MANNNIRCQHIKVETLDLQNIKIDSPKYQDVYIDFNRPIHIDGDIYDGQYIVVPKPFDETILNTTNKILKDDIEVKKIPYFETANEYGDTVYIGSEVL